MAQDVIIRGVTYQGVEKLSLPVSGGSALFRDTSDGDLVSVHLLTGEKGYGANGAVNGSMVNQGAVSGTISDKDTPYTIPAGYHNGSGTVEIASAQKALLLPGNIRDGVTILGVTGTYSGGGSNQNLIPSAATWAPGYFASGGGISSAQTNEKEIYEAEYIPVLPNHELLLLSRVPHANPWLGVCVYNSNYGYITRITNASSFQVDDKYYAYALTKLSASAAYIRFSMRTWGGTSEGAVYDLTSLMDDSAVVITPSN